MCQFCQILPAFCPAVLPLCLAQLPQNNSGPYTTNASSISVKSELQPISLSRVSGAVKLRTLNQGGREILELISESEPEDSDLDSTVKVTEALMRVCSRPSSTIPQSDMMGMRIVFFLFSHLLIFSLDTENQGPTDGGTHCMPYFSSLLTGSLATDAFSEEGTSICYDLISFSIFSRF
jgi:hypothetical protein